MNFRKATINELEKLLEIKRDVIEKFAPLGLNWTSSYPTAEIFRNDILSEELYVLEENGEILASVVLNTKEDDNYKNVKWENEGDGMVVHRLMVSPKYSGRGVGKKVLSNIEEMAKELKLPSVKLDTCTENVIAQKLYKSMNYKFLGEISLRGKEKRYFCLEKVL
ncbi:MAG: GNAT family N-acetyltransferase [Clostridium sp.]